MRPCYDPYARLRLRLLCAFCGMPIGEGERYYEMPDGLPVCADSDCLKDWAAPCLRLRPPEIDEEVYEE